MAAKDKKPDAISQETVRHVAGIAKITLSDSEVKQFQKDLADVLIAFKELDKIKTNEEASFHPMEIKDVLREDQPEECLPQGKALDNTAHKEKGFFRGPKVI